MTRTFRNPPHRAALVLAMALCTAPAAAEELDDMTRFVGLMNSFLTLMDAMYAAASNPEHAALLQMNSLEDIYKESGAARDMIPVYRDVVDRSTNPTVRRLARMRLADLLKETGEREQAIAVLREAIDDTVRHANEQAP